MEPVYTKDSGVHVWDLPDRVPCIVRHDICHQTPMVESVLRFSPVCTHPDAVRLQKVMFSHLTRRRLISILDFVISDFMFCVFCFLIFGLWIFWFLSLWLLVFGFWIYDFLIFLDFGFLCDSILLCSIWILVVLVSDFMISFFWTLDFWFFDFLAGCLGFAVLYVWLLL